MKPAKNHQPTEIKPKVRPLNPDQVYALVRREVQGVREDLRRAGLM